MQRFNLIGRTTRDVVVNTTDKGVSVAKFGVAVNRKFEKDKADFFDVICFRGQADYVGKYLEKGKQVAVSGVLNVNHYDGKDGSKRTSIEVVADEVQILEFGEKKEEKKLTPVTDDEQLPF